MFTKILKNLYKIILQAKIFQALNAPLLFHHNADMLYTKVSESNRESIKKRELQKLIQQKLMHIHTRNILECYLLHICSISFSVCGSKAHKFSALNTHFMEKEGKLWVREENSAVSAKENWFSILTSQYVWKENVSVAIFYYMWT